MFCLAIMSLRKLIAFLFQLVCKAGIYITYHLNALNGYIIEVYKLSFYCLLRKTTKYEYSEKGNAIKPTMKAFVKHCKN